MLTLTCGVDGTVVRLLPSLTIPENLLREGLDILAEAIKRLAGDTAQKVNA